jgi:hypothetical protein
MAWFPAAAAFPRLARLVRHNVAGVVKDSRKFEAFKEFGQLKEAQARAALSESAEPIIRIKPLGVGTFGHYSSGDDIYISEVIAGQYEAIFDAWGMAQSYGRNDDANEARWRKLVEQADRILESTILHEIVHWGDRKADGLTSDLEAMRHGWKDVGHMFVKFAYGKQFVYVKEKLRGRVVVRLPDLEIDGWIGWDSNGRPFDPLAKVGPASGPVSPPR